MEALAWFFFILIVGGLGWLVFSEGVKGVGEDISEIKSQLPSSEELSKLTKAKLVDLAKEHNIIVDIKSTKKVIIEEIESNR